jgi:hypothetical protein
MIKKTGGDDGVENMGKIKTRDDAHYQSWSIGVLMHPLLKKE